MHGKKIVNWIALTTLLVVAGRPAHAAAVDDLPLIVEPPRSAGSSIAIFMTGDGGWAAIDREVSETLLAAGYGVVGLDAWRYLRDDKTSAELTRDLESISHFFFDAWQRSELVLIGYSRGADLLPFAVPDLPASVADKLRAVVLLSPATFTSFKVRLADLWSNRRYPDSVETLPAARKVTQRVLCFYGADDSDSLCPALEGAAGRTVLSIDGGHHFDGDYAALGEKVLAALTPP